MAKAPAPQAIAKKKIVPLNDNVLVKLEIYKLTAGGIELPAGTEEVKSGYIVAIGQGVSEDFTSNKGGGISRGAKVGDKVFLPRGDKIGDKFEDGDDILLLVPHKYIGAIVEEN